MQSQSQSTSRRDATLRLSTCFDRIRCRRCLYFAFLGLCSGFASLCYCASGIAEAAPEEFRQVVEQSKHATVPRVRCPVCYPTYALVLHTHTQQSRCLLFSFISRSSSHCRRRSQRRSRQRSRFACDHINRRLCKTFSYSFTICRSSTHIAGRASIHPTWLSISEPAQLNCPKRSAESDKRC